MMDGSRKDVTIMGRLCKRVLAWTCVFVLALSCAPALAEFSPRYLKLSAGGGMTLTLSAQASQLSPLSKASLNTVNEWLEGLQITVSAGRNSRAEAALDGEAIFQAAVQRQADYTLTSFAPVGGSYLTANGDPDALTLLCGWDSEWADPSAVPGAYLKLAPQLYEKLGSHVTPKKSKQSTSIKNASASASNEVYAFTGDEMNEFWPRVLDTILPALEDMLKDQPSLYAKAEELLENITFSGECKFKRFLNKAGEDLGIQFTGNAALDDDKRKVTLFYGFTPDKGGYLSFAAPAVKGKNNFKVTASVKLTEKNNVNTVALEGAYSRTFDGKTVSGSLNASLKNTIKDGDEKWSGKVTVSRTENKVKSTWTLTPDLTFTDEGLSGKIALQKKEGEKNTVKAELHVTVGPYEETPMPAAASAKDLRQATPEKARATVQAEIDPLIEAMSDLIAPLSAKDRASLLHDLRTDAWMNGPVVPALETAVSELDEMEEEEEAPDDDWDEEEADG